VSSAIVDYEENAAAFLSKQSIPRLEPLTPKAGCHPSFLIRTPPNPQLKLQEFHVSLVVAESTRALCVANDEQGRQFFAHRAATHKESDSFLGDLEA
jgi:hypothetical protein